MRLAGRDAKQAMKQRDILGSEQIYHRSTRRSATGEVVPQCGRALDAGPEGVTACSY